MNEFIKDDGDTMLQIMSLKERVLKLRRRNTIFICFLIITVVGLKIKSVIDSNNLYSNIVNSNWNIELPKETREVYPSGNEESFLGDGKKYHILKYGNDEIDSSLDWNTKKDSDSSELYIIFIPKLDSVYIVEDIY